jgi:sugar phosphate isomerase/epimerase
MKLGLLTACLPDLPLMKIADWAAAHDFEALEVATWPKSLGRPFEASHIDVASLSRNQAEEIRGRLEASGLELSALAYYENNLHPDPAIREEIHAHLRRTISAAQLLGCALVGTFIGRDPSRSVRENVRLAEVELPPLVECAAERGVRLMVENCPMEGWHPDGYPGNLGYSPELWEWMYSLGFYLNYDPSHLAWLGIDPVAAIRARPERIVHAQAKDVEIQAVARNETGIFGKALNRSDPWDNGWYRYRIPGLGAIDWRRIIDTLYQVGFDGVVSIEHEDPVWTGNENRLLSGLLIGHTTLRPFIQHSSGNP